MPVDPESLQRLRAGAKVAPRAKLPFDGLDPNAPFDKQFRYKTNAYERTLFKYLAGLRGQGESMQALMRKLARDAALAELAKGG